MIALILLVLAAFALGFGVCYAWRFRPMHKYDVVIHGWHSHACTCGAMWAHNDEVMRLGEIMAAHTCHHCGTVVLQVHDHHQDDA